jgi:hypothetical protein
MKIPTMHVAKLKDVNRKRERENESRCIKELIMHLQTMISLIECEESDHPDASLQSRSRYIN